MHGRSGQKKGRAAADRESKRGSQRKISAIGKEIGKSLFGCDRKSNRKKFVLSIVSLIKFGLSSKSKKMARLLLLADSNFRNNIQAYPGPKIRDLELRSCQSRQAIISELASVEEGIVVISCLDILAADVIKTTVGEADGAVELNLNRLFHKLIDRVEETDGKVAFGVVAPLYWRCFSAEVKRAMSHVVKNMRKTPMTKIWISGDIKDVWAGADGVHLTSASANRYIKQVKSFIAQISRESGFQCVMFDGGEAGEAGEATGSNWAESSMEMDSDFVNALGPPDEATVVTPSRVPTMLSPSMLEPLTRIRTAGAGGISSTQDRLMRLAAPQPDVPLPDLSLPPPTPVQNLADVNGRFAKIDQRLGSLETKSHYSNLMMATLKEDQDTEANRAMLNKVTISGVEIPNITNMADVDKVKAMRAKVGEIIDSLKEVDQVFEVQFVKHLNKQIRGQKYSVLEVRFPDTKQAKEFRNEFVKKRKSLPEKVNVTPVVRLATRVRIEMMHSICEVMKHHDNSIIRAHCLQFVPKPVIKVVWKSAAGNELAKTISFIEAVCWVRENGYEKSIDLKKARDRAGAAFKGTLAQNFVLME